MNTVYLQGNLGRDPESKKLPSETTVCSFSVATTDRIKRGAEWVDDVQWHNVVVFGKRAELAKEHLSKGTPVLVEGRIVTRRWEDRDGKKQYRTEIIANEVRWFSSQKKSDPYPSAPADSYGEW